MGKQVFLLSGILFVLWAGFGFGDETSATENLIQGATLPTRVVGSIAAIGDSITAAFNAAYSEFESCKFRDTPAYNFATNKSKNTTFSIAERVMAYKGDIVATANFGQDGARMSHGDDQAKAAKTWLMKQATPHLVIVFLGHNDICSGTKDKFSTCESANRDPNNYCRTSFFAYEQQMRQMLDVLITIPDSQILIIHPIRVSQLCNFRNEKVIDVPWTSKKCGDLWDAPMNIFGQKGICPSLTDCTAGRIADAYTTWVAYREIADRLVDEYNSYTAGDTIPANDDFGTGSVVRAPDICLVATNVIGNSKFQYRDTFGNPQLSVCECFHPSKYGQNLLANLLWNGVTCSEKTPCCDDSIESDTDYDRGLCKSYSTSGSMTGPWTILDTYKILKVEKIGSGTGVVASTSPGIDCGSACDASFLRGSTVKIRARADADSVFKGWSGACSGSAKACTLGMSEDRVVTATFLSDPTIKVTPTRKNFKKVKLTMNRVMIFTIRNKITKGKKDLFVGTITSDNPVFVPVDDLCSNTSVSPKRSCKFKIQFSPVVGHHTAKITIPTNDPQATNTEIILIGEGIP